MHLYETPELIPLPVPFDRIDKRHGQRYVLEVVTRIPNGAFSMHAWLRLYDPYGRMISIGFFGQKPIDGFRQFLRHLFPQKGRILVPDIYELITPQRDQIATPIEISSEDYWLLLDCICCLRDRGTYKFQVLDLFLGTNCAGFINQVVKAIGINLGRVRLNLPSQITRWQRHVHQWRETELRRTLNNEALHPDAVERIHYDLPPGYMTN